MSSLAQSYLAGVVIHSGFGLGDQDCVALSYQRIIGRLERGRERRTASLKIRIIKDCGNSWRLCQPELIAIAVVCEMDTILSVISHTQRQLVGKRTLNGKVVLLDIRWLVILRPNRVGRVVNAERLSE